MLVATLRSDGPLEGAPLVYDRASEHLSLEGRGEITAAKLIDLENRRQLLWADAASRDLVLEVARARIRAERAEKTSARAQAAAVLRAHEPGTKATGIPAASTRFEPPATTTTHRRSGIVWVAPVPRAREPARTPSSAVRWRRALVWFAAAAVCIAAVGLVVAFPHQIGRQLSLSFTRHVTPYTELYFPDPAALPTPLRVPGPNRFTFTLVNHEGHRHVYRYLVTLTGPHGTSVVGDGTLALKDGAAGSRAVDFVAPRRHAAYLLSVTIANPSQSIFFRGRT